MKRNDIQALAASTGLALVLAASVAGPARAAADGLEEIVVTGEFRKESQQHTPIAISFVSEKTLVTKSIDNLRDIASRVPGLFVSPTALTHSTASYYIRGIGETDSIANQTVGTYVDDVYIARPTGATFELNDVNNIQVLRGPQGTLYGRNSSAGAVKVTTATPGNDLHVFGEVGLGNHDAFNVRAGVSGPIVQDKVAAGISYIHRGRQGLVYDVTTNTHVGKLQSDSVRVKFNFTPNEKLQVLLTGEYFKDKSDPTPLIARITPDGILDPNRNFSNTPISNSTDLGGVSLRAIYQLNDVSSLKSVTSFRAFRQPGLYDQDGSALLINRTFSFHRNENAIQEFQYLYDNHGIHAVAGLFGLFDNFRSYRTNYSPLASTSLLPSRTSLQDSAEKTKNLSVYGQATYDVTHDFHVIVGGRYTWESHNFRFTGNTDNNLSGAALRYFVPLYTVSVPYKTWRSFTPKLGLTYDLGHDASVYATYSKGFKAGGFDGRANTRVAAGLPYNPENVRTWEGGVKAEFLDRAVRTNLAVFHNIIDGYQASALDENNVTHRINLAKVRTQGFELEATVRPVNGLTWTSNLSLLDSKVISVDGAASNIVYLGKRVINAPKWQYFTSLDYDLPLNTPGVYSIGADFFYRSRIFGDITNLYVGVPQKIFNISASYTTDDGRWQIAATAQNLFNKQYDQGGTVGNGITTTNATTFNDPRLWLVKVRFNY